MDKKIENLCSFIQNELYVISTDKDKLNYYIITLQSLNTYVLKVILKSTFSKEDSNDVIIKRLCDDFHIDYEKLIINEKWVEKANKYVDYFKFILYL